MSNATETNVWLDDDGRGHVKITDSMPMPSKVYHALAREALAKHLWAGYDEGILWSEIQIEEVVSYTTDAGAIVYEFAEMEPWKS